MMTILNTYCRYHFYYKFSNDVLGECYIVERWTVRTLEQMPGWVSSRLDFRGCKDGTFQDAASLGLDYRSPFNGWADTDHPKSV